MTTVSFAPTKNADINYFVNVDRTHSVRPQVETAILSVGVALKDATEINLIGMPAPAVMQVAAFELAIGLPTISIVEPGRPGGPEPRYVGPFDLDNYRHKVARELRDVAWREGQAYSGWTVLNGSGREVPDFQLVELAEKLEIETSAIRVLNAPADKIAMFEDPAAGMAESLAALSDMTHADWVSGRLVVFVPGLGLGAVLFTTSVYALAERWPMVANLQSGADRAFHLFELCDPQPMRDWGQALAKQWQSDQTAEALKALVAQVNAGDGEVRVEMEGNTLVFKSYGPTVKLTVSSAEVINS